MDKVGAHDGGARRVLSRLKVIVVLPAYNAERTLGRTLDELPWDIVSEAIIVDDRSRDDTLAGARRLAAEHPDRRIPLFEHGE